MISIRRLVLGAVGAAVLSAPLMTAPTPAVAQDDENVQFIPRLVYRTGPYAPNGIPIADGFLDYYKLINWRDGGINGVKLMWEECETAYNNDRGVECYERLKNKGPTGAAVFNPFSTGITYALIDRATSDKIPILSMGYGRADASYGPVFPYVFTMPATYWSGADMIVTHIADEMGGFDQLKGKTLALVYHDSAYGKEPIETLKRLGEQYGYDLKLFPVPHPGLEQKSTWLQIGRRLRPDYTIMWGWGVMNSTAIKEAAAVGYPMETFIGTWWSGAEPDVEPAGDAAKGYKALQFTGVGTDSPIYEDLKKMYAEGEGMATEDQFGDVLYNRGMANGAFVVEAIRTAQEKFGNKPLTGEQVRWGFENLKLTQEKIEDLGLTGLVRPVTITCMDHEGGGDALVQQWTGSEWKAISDWIEPHREEIQARYKESALQYAEEKGIEPRDCN